MRCSGIVPRCESLSEPLRNNACRCFYIESSSRRRCEATEATVWTFDRSRRLQHVRRSLRRGLRGRRCVMVDRWRRRGISLAKDTGLHVLRVPIPSIPRDPVPQVSFFDTVEEADAWAEKALRGGRFKYLVCWDSISGWWEWSHEYCPEKRKPAKRKSRY
jgi:hypothetical protein